MLSDFWWFTWLAILAIFTEEAAPLMGGMHEHSHPFRLMIVWLSIAAGTYAADIVLYYLGRWRGEWVRRRWPKVRVFLLRAFKIVRRHPWRASLAVRYAYGLRFTLPIACGAARIPIVIYAIGAGISAITWAALITALGWGFGQTAEAMLGHVRRYERFIFPAILLAIFVGFLIARKKKVQEEMVEVIATGHLIPPSQQETQPPAE